MPAIQSQVDPQSESFLRERAQMLALIDSFRTLEDRVRNTSNSQEAKFRARKQLLPRERIALHVCRGNWSPDESVALTGSYAPLIPTLAGMRVGAYLLEACTPRAGDMALLQQLPDDARIGVGVVNQKHPTIEPVDEIVARIVRAAGLFGAERLLLHPDCGFATFADNPICSMQVAEAKLAAIVQAAQRFTRM